MHEVTFNIIKLIAAITFTWWLPMASNSLAAQEKFTDHLQRENDGQGRICIKQDPEIERLVNGEALPTTKQSNANEPAAQNAPAPADSTALTDSTQLDMPIFGRRVRTNGYRIQIYAGANNRKSKTEAYHVAGLVHSYFDDVSVYTYFQSPRWVCRVGDCKNIEEASELLKRLQQTGKFPEATIVKTKIIILKM